MLGQSKFRPSIARTVFRAAIVLILSHGASLALAQRAPVSPDHAWHGLGETKIGADARNFTEPGFNLDQEKTYSLPELIDLAESHNPETRVAWERARAQAMRFQDEFRGVDSALNNREELSDSKTPE